MKTVTKKFIPLVKGGPILLKKYEILLKQAKSTDPCGWIVVKLIIKVMKLVSESLTYGFIEVCVNLCQLESDKHCNANGHLLIFIPCIHKGVAP